MNSEYNLVNSNHIRQNTGGFGGRGPGRKSTFVKIDKHLKENQNIIS